jgi:hypothetical protein
MMRADAAARPGWAQRGRTVGERTLWYGAWSGDARLTRELLAEGADPNGAVAGGKTPLMEAVDEPGQFFDATREAVVEALLTGGAGSPSRCGSTTSPGSSAAAPADMRNI